VDLKATTDESTAVVGAFVVTAGPPGEVVAAAAVNETSGRPGSLVGEAVWVSDVRISLCTVCGAQIAGLNPVRGRESSIIWRPKARSDESPIIDSGDVRTKNGGTDARSLPGDTSDVVVSTGSGSVEDRAADGFSTAVAVSCAMSREADNAVATAFGMKSRPGDVAFPASTKVAPDDKDGLDVVGAVSMARASGRMGTVRWSVADDDGDSSG
jgi:hypothetical protein